MNKVKLYTIGFTKKNAEKFFTTLKSNKITKLIDIRLNNVSQLAGFAKRDDLIFFLKEICQINYKHILGFAPTEEILNGYKKQEITWESYVSRFSNLLEERKIENILTRNELDNACLLCSESTAEQCHRRLVAEYLKKKLGDIEIRHL
ncbi:MAG: DUF488 domain-containing protein [Candidatus Omnitrophica bacterium]|nr:DUF488 domain-containing protein [Candidatus Omnitrophota bacterium]